MAWKWNEVERYKISIGASEYHAGVQLWGPNAFFANIKFLPGRAPAGDAPAHHGNSFWGNLDFSQFAAFVDILRNEKPVRFGYDGNNANKFHLMSGMEPVGEGDGVLGNTP